jgi:hypothetical protein
VVGKAMIVTDAAFEYLAIQRGNIAQHAANRMLWENHYRHHLQETFASIERFIPKPCNTILDIGSGMGGINIPIVNKTRAKLYLLDGDDCPPEHINAHTPFNNMAVAIDFLKRNGIYTSGFFTPLLEFEGYEEPREFDLVTSFAAWGFHIPPQQYMRFVREKLRMHGRLILDVRATRIDWIMDFEDEFSMIEWIAVTPKITRYVYEKTRP